MNTIIKRIFIGLSLVIMGLWSCMDDKGNYDYDFDSVQEIKIDTSGMDRSQLYASWNIGDTIRLSVKVNYNKPENLVYSWFTLPNNYRPEEVGNILTYPQNNVIGTSPNLEYVVALEAGKAYQVWFMAKDTVNNLYDYIKLINYTSIPEAGEIKGFYCLHEKSGKLEVDIFSSPLALIYSYQSSSTFHVKDYWSTMHPESPLQGSTGKIYGSGAGWYYIFTDQEGFRCSPNNLVIMDTWEEMFHNSPVYAPESYIYINNVEFLINNGKLHCHYMSPASGDRKFLEPLSGIYNLAPFLARKTRTSYSPVTNAINAYQVVFDKEKSGYRPFYSLSSTLSSFQSSTSTALFDVNNMEGEIIYSATAGEETVTVMKEGTDYTMYVSCFYNVEDNGSLARRAPISLAGCTDINKASVFATSGGGPALFYAVGNKLYSFSYVTGLTTSKMLWASENSREEITFLYVNQGGGFPTGEVVLYIALWNPDTQKGRIMDLEFDPTTGEGNTMWRPMFGGGNENPCQYEALEDFGKILFISEKQ